MATTANSQRYLALDVLRGMTVAGMILVNNPGTWSHIFAPLRHAPWVGCTPTDLVFPFFLFCVGVSMAFSFAKYGDTLDKKTSCKLVKRGLIIYLIGLGMSLVPFFPYNPHNPEGTLGENYIYWLQHVRLFGVLPRIGMCYILGGFLALSLKTPKKLIIGIAAVTVLHWLILMIFGTEPGWSTLEGNVAGKIDIALVGEGHVYHGYGVPFDPEGLFGALSGAGTVLLGYLVGYVIRHTDSKIDVVAKLYTIAAICLALGCIWSIWLPISKALWTGSYVLYAGGWAIFCLAFFIYFIDIKGKEKIFTPFKAMGRNPLFAFVMAGLIGRIFGAVVKVGPTGAQISPLRWFYLHCCCPVFGGDNEYASLMYAICFVCLFFAMAIGLYKKNIIIKI